MMGARTTTFIFRLIFQGQFYTLHLYCSVLYFGLGLLFTYQQRIWPLLLGNMPYDIIGPKSHWPSNLWYMSHLRRYSNCWSLRRYWSIACWRCSNCIFILDLTPGFSGLGRANCETRRESFKCCDLVRLIQEVWRYVKMRQSSQKTNASQKANHCAIYIPYHDIVESMFVHNVTHITMTS